MRKQAVVPYDGRTMSASDPGAFGIRHFTAPDGVDVDVDTAYVFDPLGRLESGSPTTFKVGGRRLSIDTGSGFVAFE